MFRDATRLGAFLTAGLISGMVVVPVTCGLAYVHSEMFHSGPDFVLPWLVVASVLVGVVGSEAARTHWNDRASAVLAGLIVSIVCFAVVAVFHWAMETSGTLAHLDEWESAYYALFYRPAVAAAVAGLAAAILVDPWTDPRQEPLARDGMRRGER